MTPTESAELDRILEESPGPPAIAEAPARTLVLEHKTSSEDIGLGSVYWTKLTLDAQLSNYLVGARALGFAPDRVLYDVLRKPAQLPSSIPVLDPDGVKIVLDASGQRVRTKDGKKFRETGDSAAGYVLQTREETPEEYRDRILADIAERPDYYYQRGEVVRLADEERDAAFDVWQTAEGIRLARVSGRWLRNVDACSQFNRLCDYWEICSGQSSVEDGALYEKVESPHVELDGKHHLTMLTSSSARAFRACPRRYYFAYELSIRSRKQATALRFGKIVHAGLEAWLLSGGNLETALADMRSAHRGPYDHEAAKAEAMLRGYHARWADEPLEVVAVEKEFTADLVNPETGGKSRTFVRAGKIDAIVRHKG